MRPRPKRPPRRCTAESAFCAASVTSVASGGVRQRSHTPHGLHAGLAEVAAHGGRAAAGAVEHGVELAQLAHLHGLDAGVDVAAVDAAHGPGEIGGGVERDALGRLAVAAGAADLLPVGLDRRRRIGVDDVAHVGLVDAHAEGDGRDHHGGVRLQELLEPRRAHILVETGVIGQRRHAGGNQAFGQLVDAVARAGIDHAGALGPLGHQLQHAAVALPALALGRQGQLGPREAVDELARVPELQLGADVVAGAGIGGGGDGQARHVRERRRRGGPACGTRAGSRGPTG